MKRLFFFSGYKLIAYHWHKGEFIDREEFEPKDEDKDRLLLYLQKEPDVPARFLIDIIEEEFRLEALPYATGSDRKSLFERTKSKLFRNSKYVYLEMQGRQKEGRRDMEVLVSGLLSPEGLEYWLKVIQSAQVPLEGIYSLPIVGELITEKLLVDKVNTLVVSQQGPANLRQSYYVNGKLKQSRLSAISDERDMDFVYLVESEINKTLRFLETTRVRKRQDQLNISIIVSNQSEGLLEEHLRRKENTEYSILSHKKAVARVGIKGKILSPYSDILYAQLLLEKLIYKNQYAPVAQRSHYYHLLINRFLRYSSFTVAAVILIMLISGGLTWLEKQDQLKNQQNDIVSYKRKLSEQLKKIVKYTYRATTTKEIVELYDKLRVKTVQEPRLLFMTLSQAFKQNTHVVPVEIAWIVTQKKDKNLPARFDDIMTAPLSFSKKVYLIAEVKGKVIAFDDNYRRAIHYHQGFLDSLAKIKAIVKLENKKAPFNLNSSSEIIGDSGTNAQKKRKQDASFITRITLEVK